VTDFFKNYRRMLIYVVVSNFLLNIGFQVWQTMFNNYAVEEIGVGPASMGLIQSVREIPGLLGFLLAFLALILSEVRIMALSLVLMGVGLIATGQSSSTVLLLAATLMMSIGFHFFYAASNSVVLMIVKKSDTPKTLGGLGSIGSLAAVVGTGIVYFLAAPVGYRPLFVAVGALVIVGGLALLPFGNAGDGLPANRRIIFRKRYWLYYTLSFLLGCRRHIFTTFAIFLLVSNYGVTVQTTALLFLANSVVNVFTLRWTGWLVGQLGERLALSIAFATLIFIFLGYAYLPYLPVLYGLFVLDNVMFGLGVGLTTYFQKIAVSPEEITSNVSAEQTINHSAAIIVPVLGGIAWARYGFQAPFLIGVVIVTVSLALTQLIRTDALPATAVPATP
jgi:predicted MFS family arabinose efflux permease